MKFMWPEMLWLLAAIPLLVALYVWLLRRRKKLAVRYASLAIVKDAMRGGLGWRRHVPPLLLLAAIAVMLLGIARPTAVMTLPTQQETIILAMDVSGSMRARDIQPSRLVASQNAARTFINQLPSHTRVGIVSFAGTAAVVQAPTLNREDALAAIDRFYLQRGTATGSGLLVALATLFPDHGIDVSEAIYGRDSPRSDSRGTPLGGSGKTEKPPFTPVQPGSYTSAAIVLLTDGQRTTGPDPIDAARLAAERGVRVFTVGVGTVEGEVIGFEGWSFRAQLDEDALKAVAKITQGEYFHASNAEDLKKIYQMLNSRLVLTKRETEITALFSALAAVVAVGAASLSMLWFNRIV
ncbi:MAG TPA: VWA domain-containing protein [Burkholderiaceae bacterium]|nr:VWA domain-containing protein [Burkholderiaceae bacterium]